MKNYKKNIIIIFDFDGVISITDKEPLISSLKILGMGYPNQEIIDSYKIHKKEISSLSKLYNFIKKQLDININEEEFKSKLFNHRRKNIKNSEYKKLFKPTLIFVFFKYLSYFFDCCILTSRDVPTISMFMNENNFKKKIPIYSNTQLNKSKYEVIKKILNSSKYIIFLDDMLANIKGYKEKNNVSAIHVRTSDNNFLQFLMRIFTIIKTIFNIIKNLISNK
mgnify:CR=1 FL=1